MSAPDLGLEAYHYARARLSVFPLQPREKKPYGFTTGLHAASKDPRTVEAWWLARVGLPMRAPKHDGERLPASVFAARDANIGLATGARSGCWVLDIDGEAGIASLLQLAGRYGRLPLTVRQNTGKGGHLFFAWPGELPWGGEIRNGASKFAEGLDVRGEGGYVVLPPSVHPSGRRYEWVQGCAPDEMGFAKAPLWLLKLVAPPPPAKLTQGHMFRAERDARAGGGQGYALAALDAARAEIAMAPPGQQNETLHRNAYGIGRLVAGDQLQRDGARSGLIAAGLSMANGDARNPWTEADVARMVDSAFRRAQAEPRREPAGRRR